MRLSEEQEQQMVGARRQLLAGLQRSRAQRQRLIAQLRPADGEMPTNALASNTLELVSPKICRHLHASSKMQLASPNAQVQAYSKCSACQSVVCVYTAEIANVSCDQMVAHSLQGYPVNV